MPLKAAEMKAVAWYVQDRGLKPSLSTPPRMYFKDKEGNQVEADLAGIVTEYKAWNEQDKKERAREKRVADTRRIIRRVVQ